MADDTILVVEDNPTNMRLLEFILTSHGYRIRTAADAREALTVLASFRPRLILLDLQLPGMGGLQLARQLKADPATRSIVIVAVTAFAMKGDDQKALDAGCDGYVSKPIHPTDLLKVVAAHIGGPPTG